MRRRRTLVVPFVPGPDNTGATLPAWLSSVTPGDLVELTGTRLSTVAYAHGGDAVGYQTAVINAWCGAGFDESTGKAFSWGGGHGDYNGNEAYYCDFSLATPAVGVFSLPSASLPATNSSSAYSDGKPASSHTYDLIHVDPIRRKLFLLGLGGVFNTGSEAADVRALDLDTQTWNDTGTDSYPSVPLNSGQAYTQGACACWDATRQGFWVKQVQTGTLRFFNPAARTWTNYSDGRLYNYDAVIRHDVTRDLLISIGGYGEPTPNGPTGGGGNEIIIHDLSTLSGGSVTTYQRSVTGLPAKKGWGLRYVQADGKFLAYRGGQTIYVLSPGASPTGNDWLASGVTMGGATAPAEDWMGKGVYSRLIVHPTWRVALFNGCESDDASDHEDTNWFAWRLPASL